MSMLFNKQDIDAVDKHYCRLYSYLSKSTYDTITTIIISQNRRGNINTQ